MTYLELIGLIGSIASVIGVIPICFYGAKKVESMIIYNKLIKMNDVQLQNFFCKSNKDKRQLIKEQNSKLKDDIGKVKKGCINKAILNKCIINMIESQESIDDEEE